jgi:dihydroorotase
MGQEKQLILKEVVEAQHHGIIFDCAHGRSHFSFPLIEKALEQGFLPDTISTDLTFTSATSGPVFDLPTRTCARETLNNAACRATWRPEREF